MPRRILLDVDTGTDDALAILYAVGHPELEVLGISCVAGNVPIDQVVINTCKVLDAAGAAGIPIAAGALQPLLESARRTGKSHGVDGLGGIRLPATSRQRSPLHAVELLHQLIMASTQRLTLVTLAPKTNVALLLTMYPEVATRLDHIIFMGGATAGGNVTALAEFNVWQDPEAAQCVIQSPVPITLYGLETFSRLTVDRADADRIRAHGHSAVRLAGELLYRRRPGRRSRIAMWACSAMPVPWSCSPTRNSSLLASFPCGSTSRASAAGRRLSISVLGHATPPNPISGPGSRLLLI